MLVLHEFWKSIQIFQADEQESCRHQASLILARNLHAWNLFIQQHTIRGKRSMQYNVAASLKKHFVQRFYHWIIYVGTTFQGL